MIRAKKRYFVPDLTPMDREALQNVKPEVVFIAESPHVNEIEAERPSQRRPLCGMAGQKWWAALETFFSKERLPNLSADSLVEFCQKNRIAVMNAVQYPLDPKITKSFPDAEPVQNLGFQKSTGEHSFKRKKAGKEVQAAIQSLRERLSHPSLRGAKIYPLGNDAEWFLKQAFPEGTHPQLGERIPHPSAWWRKGGYYGRVAHERLNLIFCGNKNSH